MCCAQSLQSCLTLCNPMDYSLPDSSVHGILQARILEWAAMPSPRGSSLPRDQTCTTYISCIDQQVLYHWHHLGSPPGYAYFWLPLPHQVLLSPSSGKYWSDFFAFPRILSNGTLSVCFFGLVSFMRHSYSDILPCFYSFHVHFFLLLSNIPLYVDVIVC